MTPDFPRESVEKTPSILSVSALNQAVQDLLERNLPPLWVCGEISNFTRASSGHWYFTLKDAAAQARAVMFKSRSNRVDFQPREGDKVEVRAQASLYTPRGDFQLQVDTMRLAGSGALYETFLRRKAALEAAGYFAQSRPLPGFVRRLAVITSLHAAALRDVQASLARRAAHVEVLIYPCAVQGEEAPSQIVSALQRAGREDGAELILLVRGGGSIEDLWAFNDPDVVRAIVATSVPVVSGVGHETDFTLADFAADLRAATPTAAAELATPAQADCLARLEHLRTRMAQQMRQHSQRAAQQIDHLSARLRSPRQLCAQKNTHIQLMQRRLHTALASQLNRSRTRWLQIDARLHALRPNPEHAAQQLAHLHTRLTQAHARHLQQHMHALELCRSRLDTLAPARTLARGYAIVRDAEGRILRTLEGMRAPLTLDLQLADAHARLDIQAIR